MEFKILQCGFPKSGNFLLYSILKNCLTVKGIFTNFSRKSGLLDVYRKLYQLFDLKEAFEGNLEIDMIECYNGKLYLYKPFCKKDLELIEVDLAFMIENSSLIWSHSRPSDLDSILSKFTHRFYLLRDGRDVVNSYMHHMIREEIRNLNPSYKYKEINEIYSDFGLFEKYVILWKEHVNSYLSMRKEFVLVRFESLKEFGVDFKKILEIFSLKSKEKDLRRKFTFTSMKRKSPTHLRKGSTGDWKNYFSPKHKEVFKEIAGETLIELGYEKDFNW